jgi:hypothetical protein
MATKKITDLVELISAASGDVLPIVDISDDITKKIQVSNFPISTATQTAIDAKQDTLVSGTNIKTLNSESLLGSGNIEITASPAGVAGAIQFSDGSAFASDASNLFWDDTNNRLGIGTNAPDTTAHFKGGVSGAVGTRIATFEGSLPEILFKDTFNNTGFAIAKYGNLVYFTNTNAIGGYSSYSGLINSNRQWSLGHGSNPTATVDIKGSGSTSATTSLLVQNSSGTEAFKVNDAGDLFFNGLETSSMRIHTLGNINKGISIDNEIDMGAFSGITFKAWDGSAYSNFMRIIGNTASRGLIIGGTTNDASAKLQIDSTTQGFLPPRMTTTQKNAISSPASGLIVYDTDTNKLCCYNGTSWNDLF